MRRLAVAFAFVALPLAGVLGLAQSATRSQSGLQLDALDRTVDACTDFYQYSCGGWMAKNPIPADRSSWGRFDELQERNTEILREVLDRAASGQDPSQKKIGDYYASCLDEPAIEAKGITPLDPLTKKIAGIAKTADLPPVVADLQAAGVNVLFYFGAEADYKDTSTVLAYLSTGGMGLPDRDYYLRDDPKSIELRKQYVDHIAKMLGHAGGAAASAMAAADRILKIETTLARGALDRVARRDPNNRYHKLSAAELQALTPRFQWPGYFARAGAPPIQALNVTEPNFFKAVDEVLSSTPVDDVKAYFRWQLLRSSAPVLPAAFVNENFSFYGTILTGAKELRPRWKRCEQFTDDHLGEALGKAYVEKAFGPTAKADMLKMIDGIEAALAKDVNELTWMTSATKQQALAKLRTVSNKIGYPDRWRDYAPLTVTRGDAVGNWQRANAFEREREMQKIGKPLDKSEWGMTPPTVNAYFDPLQNNINFPAGILQSPFYDPATDRAVNYGGAGAVIGHELTHGFDDSGRQFDAQGNLKDWWSPEDAKAFVERAQCFVDEYAGFTAIDDVKLNGRLTLGENTADNGGLRLTLMAYLATLSTQPSGSLDGFTPEQRVFLGWGQVWCEARRPEALRLMAQTNPHSPGRYRVNGVVSNMPEFQKAFGCKADAPMVRQNQCRVW